MISDTQRAALDERVNKLINLDDELRTLGDKAIAIGELEDDLNGRSYSRILFNLARAVDAADVATGELDPSEVKLRVFMHDPDEIIARCDLLIDAANDMIFDLCHLLRPQ